jgi:hypothetical protein
MAHLHRDIDLAAPLFSVASGGVYASAANREACSLCITRRRGAPRFTLRARERRVVTVNIAAFLAMIGVVHGGLFYGAALR